MPQPHVRLPDPHEPWQHLKARSVESFPIAEYGNAPVCGVTRHPCVMVCCDCRTAQVLCFTWNMGDAKPYEEELEQWLPDKGGRKFKRVSSPLVATCSRAFLFKHILQS